MFTNQLTKVQEILQAGGAGFNTLEPGDEVIFVTYSGRFYSAAVINPPQDGNNDVDAVQFFAGEWHCFVEYEFEGTDGETYTSTGWQTLANVAVVS